MTSTEISQNAQLLIEELDVLPQVIKDEALNLRTSLDYKTITVEVGSSDEGSRKMAGLFVMNDYPMSVEKPYSWSNSLHAKFKGKNGWTFIVDEYKTRNCKLISKQEWVEPEEEKPAKEGHYKTVQVLECEGKEVKVQRG